MLHFHLLLLTSYFTSDSFRTFSVIITELRSMLDTHHAPKFFSFLSRTLVVPSMATHTFLKPSVAHWVLGNRLRWGTGDRIRSCGEQRKQDVARLRED
jgi:hypothetical protein